MSKLNIKNIVIHHYPCPDGELSAAIFQQRFNNCIFIPWMHELKKKNVNIILETIEKYSKDSIVYFLDYCPDFMTAFKISTKVKSVLILDHHQSACIKFKEDFDNYLKQIPNLSNIKLTFDNNKSGCQLCWDYCYPNKIYPLSVKHIGNRDIWVWEDPLTEPFTSAYQLHYQIKNNLLPEERLNIYSNILNCDENIFKSIVKMGNIQISKMKNECLGLLPIVNVTIDFDIEGKQLLIVEVPMTKYHLTKYIQELIQEKYPDHDILRMIFDKEDMKVFSLRSLKPDIRVDLLAQKYGGNGHMQASGYSINY